MDFCQNILARLFVFLAAVSTEVAFQFILLLENCLCHAIVRNKIRTVSAGLNFGFKQSVCSVCGVDYY